MASGKLLKLRTGAPTHQSITIGGEEFKVVLLPTDTTRAIEEETERYVNANKDKSNDISRSKYYDRLLVYHCLRDPDDPTLQTKAAGSVDEVGSTLDDADIAKIIDKYSQMVFNKGP